MFGGQISTKDLKFLSFYGLVLIIIFVQICGSNDLFCYSSIALLNVLNKLSRHENHSSAASQLIGCLTWFLSLTKTNLKRMSEHCFLYHLQGIAGGRVCVCVWCLSLFLFLMLLYSRTVNMKSHMDGWNPLVGQWCMSWKLLLVMSSYLEVLLLPTHVLFLLTLWFHIQSFLKLVN